MTYITIYGQSFFRWYFYQFISFQTHARLDAWSTNSNTTYMGEEEFDAYKVS